MMKRASFEVKFRIYLLILSLAGTILILLTTSKYGAGVSSDAVRNLSTADNLLAGKGFVDLTGGPFILWPPLYPLILAGLSLVTNWTVFQAAWYFNIFVYALNIWLLGWFLHLAFKDKPVYAIMGALMILLFRSTLRLYANVSSEPLFVSFAVVFFLAAGKYLDDKPPGAVWLMFVMAALATLQRYLGIVLTGVGGVIVLTHEGPRGLQRHVPSILTALIPISAWVLIHNYVVSGTLVGPRDLGAMVPLENMSLALTKMVWWFIPRIGFLDPIILNPWIPLVVLTLLLIGINKKTDWMKWFRALSNRFLWPAMLFSVLYLFVVSFSVVTADHLDLTSDRYYVIILPFVLALVFVTFDNLIITHINLNNRLIHYSLIALVALWFFYPLYSLRQYIRLALNQGEPTNYNIANSAQFREMGVVKAAQNIIREDPSAVLFTNYVNIVWFIYQRPVQELPFVDQTQPRDLRIAGLKQYYPFWPGDQPGYIIWFIPNQYHNIAPPDDLALIADLKLLYEDKTGQIYYVEPHR